MKKVDQGSDKLYKLKIETIFLYSNNSEYNYKKIRLLTALRIKIFHFLLKV